MRPLGSIYVYVCFCICVCTWSFTKTDIPNTSTYDPEYIKASRMKRCVWVSVWLFPSVSHYLRSWKRSHKSIFYLLCVGSSTIFLIWRWNKGFHPQPGCLQDPHLRVVKQAGWFMVEWTPESDKLSIPPHLQTWPISHRRVWKLGEQKTDSVTWNATLPTQGAEVPVCGIAYPTSLFSPFKESETETMNNIVTLHWTKMSKH